MRQYSESDRSSAAASLARSAQRLGGTRGLTPQCTSRCSWAAFQKKKPPARGAHAGGEGPRDDGDNAARWEERCDRSMVTQESDRRFVPA